MSHREDGLHGEGEASGVGGKTATEETEETSTVHLMD
jgi:hypothetical protein